MSDFRDIRGGAYDPVNKFGNPQPPQAEDKPTPRQKAPCGADVRAEPLPGPDEVSPLPEGLRRPPRGPLNNDDRTAAEESLGPVYSLSWNAGDSETAPRAE